MSIRDTWGGSWLTSWLTSWSPDEPDVVVSNVIKTIGIFRSSMTIGNLQTNSMNGILKTSKTIGTLK